MPYAIPVITKRSGFYAVCPMSGKFGVVYRAPHVIEASGLVDVRRPLESYDANIEVTRIGKSPYYTIRVNGFGETLMFHEDIARQYFPQILEKEG